MRCSRTLHLPSLPPAGNPSRAGSGAVVPAAGRGPPSEILHVHPPAGTALHCAPLGSGAAVPAAGRGPPSEILHVHPRAGTAPSPLPPLRCAPLGSGAAAGPASRYHPIGDPSCHSCASAPQSGHCPSLPPLHCLPLGSGAAGPASRYHPIKYPSWRLHLRAGTAPPSIISIGIIPLS